MKAMIIKLRRAWGLTLSGRAPRVLTRPTSGLGQAVKWGYKRTIARLQKTNNPLVVVGEVLDNSAETCDAFRQDLKGGEE